MKMSAKVLAGSVPFFLALCSFPTQAQAQESEREPVTHGHVISGSPLLLLGGWFNAEYERKVNGSMTVGIAGGWLDMDNDDYTSVSGFFRVYPQGGAFTGFYLGGRGGIHRVNEAQTSGGSDHSSTAFGLGIDVGYSWLLGPGRSFYVGLGVGATHLFGDIGNANSTIPALRLLDVGIAF